MLNLLKNKKNKLTGFKEKLKISQIKQENNLKITRHYPISTKEWFNSVYTYDKNIMKSIPMLNLIIHNLLKMYFNLNSMGNKDKKFRKRRNTFRYRSTNKIFVSNTEMKHFNDKIIITIYTYNRTKKYIFKLLEKLYKIIFRNYFANTSRVINSFKDNIKVNKNSKFFYVNKYIKTKLKKFLNRKYKLRLKLKKKMNKVNNKTRLNFRKLRKYYLVKTYKNLYLNNLINYNITKLDINTNKQFNRYNEKKINLNKFYLNLKFLSVYDRSIIILKKFLSRSSSIFKLLKEKNIKNLDNKKKLFKLKKDYLKINKEYIKGKL